MALTDEVETYPIPALQALREAGARVAIEVAATDGGYEADRVTIVARSPEEPHVQGQGFPIPIVVEGKGSEIEAVAEMVRERMVKALAAVRVAGTPVRAF